MKAAALTMLAIQVLGIGILLFGDIGFDHPGRFGLDSVHAILIATVEVSLFIALGLLSIENKKWWPALTSLLILGAGVGLVIALE